MRRCSCWPRSAFVSMLACSWRKRSCSGGTVLRSLSKRTRKRRSCSKFVDTFSLAPVRPNVELKIDFEIAQHLCGQLASTLAGVIGVALKDDVDDAMLQRAGYFRARLPHGFVGI